MTINTFLHLFKEYGSVTFGDWVWWYKSKNLWNSVTDEVIPLKSIQNGFKHVIDGKSIDTLVAEADIHIWDMAIKGGGNSGGSKNRKEFKFGGNNGKSKGVPDLPAKVNTKIKTKTQVEGISQFRNMHGKSKIEHAVTMDKNGFVSGYHHFEKGTHFKAEAFSRAVGKVSMKGQDYDSAVTSWLRRNQKKYGYKYSLHLDKPAKTTTTTKASTSKSSKTKAPAPKKSKTVSIPEIKFNDLGQGSLF